MVGHVAGFGLPPGLVLRLFLLLHVGGGLAAPVVVVDLDHLFAGRLIAALRLRRRLRSRTLAFAAGHSQTVHEPSGIDSEGYPPELPSTGDSSLTGAAELPGSQVGCRLIVANRVSSGSS
jgi:hypothetical protein